MLKIPDFTKPEIDKILANANFTSREAELFEWKRQEKTHEECSELMHMSVATVGRTMKKIESKVSRIKIREE